LKTGARQSGITHARVEKGNKKYSHRNVCALLTCLLMGDPELQCRAELTITIAAITKAATLKVNDSNMAF
jgi:hypothetical protein